MQPKNYIRIIYFATLDKRHFSIEPNLSMLNQSLDKLCRNIKGVSITQLQTTKGRTQSHDKFLQVELCVASCLQNKTYKLKNYELGLPHVRENHSTSIEKKNNNCHVISPANE